MSHENAPKTERVLTRGNGPSDWQVIASFDDRDRLTIAKSSLDDDFYIHISAGEIVALKRILDRRCKPRAKTGNLQSDILQMLSTLFEESSDAYATFEAFCDEFGVSYTRSHWQSVD